MTDLNRRELVAATVGLGLAATALETSAASRGRAPPSTAPGWGYGPFDSLRDYVAELDRRGLLIRIPRLDQDAYEATALMYRLIDEYGLYRTPAFLVDEVKIEGRWVRGPVLVNQYGHYHTEAVALGIEPVPGDGRATYRAAIARATELLKDGKFPTAACEEVSAARRALQGGDPGGRRHRSHEVRLHPVEPGGRGPLRQHGLGLHPGSRRAAATSAPTAASSRARACSAVNPEPGQSGWQMLTKMRERGEKVAKVSIVLGQDPITWRRLHARKIGMGNPDELQLVSGLRGRALRRGEVARPTTSWCRPTPRW